MESKTTVKQTRVKKPARARPRARPTVPKGVTPQRVAKQVARGPVGGPFARDHLIDDENAVAWADSLCNPRMAGGRIPDGRCMIPTSTGQLFCAKKLLTPVADSGVPANSVAGMLLCADALIQVSVVTAVASGILNWGAPGLHAPVTSLTANTMFYRAVSCGARIIPTTPLLNRQGILKINEVVLGAVTGGAPVAPAASLDAQPTMVIIDAAKMPDEGVEVFWRPSTGGSPIETFTTTGTASKSATSWSYSNTTNQVVCVDTVPIVRWEGSSTNPMDFMVEVFYNYEAIPLFSIAQPETKTIGGGAQVVSDAIRRNAKLETPVTQQYSEKESPSLANKLARFAGNLMLKQLHTARVGRVVQRGLTAAASAFFGKGGLTTPDLERAHAIAVLSSRDNADPLQHHPHVHDVARGATPGHGVAAPDFDFKAWLHAFCSGRYTDTEVARIGWGTDMRTTQPDHKDAAARHCCEPSDPGYVDIEDCDLPLRRRPGYVNPPSSPTPSAAKGAKR